MPTIRGSSAATRRRDGSASEDWGFARLLVTQLHVSRTPVREALQRLERIGLVTMYPSRYTEVSAIDDNDIETARVFAAYQSGIVARLACERLTDAHRHGEH